MKQTTKHQYLQDPYVKNPNDSIESPDAQLGAIHPPPHQQGAGVKKKTKRTMKRSGGMAMANRPMRRGGGMMKKNMM